MTRAFIPPAAACLIAFAMAALSAVAGESHPVSFWADRQRGWHFYEEPPPAPDDAPPPKTAAPAVPRQPPEILAFERLQKRLKQSREIAIMRPTSTNVRRYMELESRVIGQASFFADVAQRIAWTTPGLDPTLQGRPVNAKALDVFEQDQLQARQRSVAALGRDHVLFFFFRSDCPYCHAFAPTLAAFQARYGMRVVPVSLDGGGLPAFPSPRHDNGIARSLRVAQVPAVFLAQPFSGKISPVGFGVLSESQLLERISILAAPASRTAAGTPLTLR